MTKILFLLSFLLTLQLLTFAQKDKAGKYAATITAADLKKQLTIIASDEMEGRETGTEGQRKAAAYIESQFKKMGLATAKSLNGYQQLYPLYQDSLSSEIEVNNQPAVYGKDYISPASNNETGSNTAASIIFAGYGIDDSTYSDYSGIDVKNKIVIFFLGEPKKDGKYFISDNGNSSKWTYPGLSLKLATAKAKGAAGAFVINPSQETFTQWSIDKSKNSTLYFPHENAGTPVNYALLSHAYAKSILGNNFDTLLKQVKAAKTIDAGWLTENKIPVQLKYNKFRTTINASNVLGVVEGTDKKDEYVFCTAHYDHLGKHDGKIYYGADDDGSGTCGVLEMAKAFAKAKAAGDGPRRTVVFMTVSGEEKGLWGSEYYSDHPVFSLDKTSADLNTDMVGRVDTERKTGDTLNYVYVIGHNKLSSDLPVINEAANTKNGALTLDYKFDDPNDNERIYYRSDHYNFARKGVPVLFFYDGMLKADYHKPTDTIDKINFALYEKRVRMIFYTAWEIANRDDMLKRDIPLTEGSR
jgi:Zn-dependent M28 family amino/carboxypeptidase